MNICISGVARSGKDTFTKFLLQKLDMKQYALAQPIKDIMCELFGWSDEHRDGAYKEIELMYSISPDSLDAAGMKYNEYGLDKYEAFHDCWEKLVDLFGIELREDGLGYCIISPRRAFQLFGTEWGRAIDDNIWLDIAPKDGVIISDIRFDNEAKYFQDSGAITILVKRPTTTRVSSHVSEAGISEDLVNIIVENSGTLQDLSQAADSMLSHNFLGGVYINGHLDL